MAVTSQPRLLIVEDSPVFRELLRGIFERRHPEAHLLEAETVADGYRLALEHEPQVIVMDVQLPDGNGLDLTRTLRETLPQIQVVVCTAHDLPEHREAALAGGACHFSCKDRLGDGSLVAVVGRLLGGGEASKHNGAGADGDSGG